MGNATASIFHYTVGRPEHVIISSNREHPAAEVVKGELFAPYFGIFFHPPTPSSRV